MPTEIYLLVIEIKYSLSDYMLYSTAVALDEDFR